MKKFLFSGVFICIYFCVSAQQQRGLYVAAENGSVIPPLNEKRFALVIGNGGYTSSLLKNPKNDASDMYTTLQSLCFETELVTDASRTDMTNAIQRLTNKASGLNAVALFYYSGHGLQVNNDNWLVPTGAYVQSEADVEVACVPLNYSMRQLGQANSGTNIIILDACRNNPFSYHKSIGGGLGQASKMPSGTYISFASAPRTTALDGAGRNSPFTTALMKAIKIPNIKIEEAFKQVRSEVQRTFGQTPGKNFSLEGYFYFNPKSNDTIVPTPPPYIPSTPTSNSYTETATGVSFSMMYVQGGTFQMGSADEDASSWEKPVHTVRVNNFYIGKYEVTFDEYDKFCDATGKEKPDDVGWGRGTRPVIKVSWNDAKAYCTWLSETSGKKYRLPTEAEWEYAARGGSNNIYSGSSDIDVTGWYAENSDKKTHAVGSKTRNSFGLYDMSGNVWEWCSDWYDEKYYENSPEDNPKGAATGSGRVYRGGAWSSAALRCRVSDRVGYAPAYRNTTLGFRVVFSSPQ